VTLESPALTLAELLGRSGIDPASVLVFRHRPYEPALNRAFDWIVAERPDLFECYQSTHAQRTESAVARAVYVASFIRHRPKEALFVGLYEKRTMAEMSVEQCVARPAHRELMSLGMSGFKATDGRSHVNVFDLARTDWHASWTGRLVVRWPGLERSWFRWADRNEFEVLAIAAESLLEAQMPAWDELVLSWRELALLPSRWAHALAQWRGVYLITDSSDRMQYVGSAAGSENILQRWLDYSRTGHGGNKLLRLRDPANFHFSILQRVSPDMPVADVIGVEKRWKDRLFTKAPAGLNEN
jgi:hypothetical protein